MKFFTRKRIIYAILFIIILGGTWFVFLRKKNTNVETLTVHPTEFLQQVSVAGTVIAPQTANLGFGQTGRITNVNVQSGSVVTAGTILGSLENGDLQAALLQKIAILQAQQANLSAIQSGGNPLFIGGQQGGITTPTDATAQQAIVNAAMADVLNAQASFNKTLIIAPFNGVVTRVDARVGEIATPGTLEISIDGGGLFQIESFVPELDIGNIRIGNTATITFDTYGAGTTFTAKVVSIDLSGTLVDNVATYKVKLQLAKQDPRIKSGMTANATITTEKKPNEIVIPQGAVFYKNGASFVQIKKGENISNQPVRIGETSIIGQVEILSGLKDGDEVVLNPTNA